MSTESSTTYEIKCWTCKGKTHLIRQPDKVNTFSICTACNPEKAIKQCIKGCEVLCQVCFEAMAYDDDTYIPCSECGKFMCVCCAANRTYNIDIPHNDETRYHCCEQCFELWRARQ